MPRSQDCAFAYAVVHRDVASLRPYSNNARTHSRKQIRQIAASIERFGFTNPVLVTDEGEIIAGHGRVRAAAQLGYTSVPTIALSHLSQAQRQAYVLADNKLALNAGWDPAMLAIELQGLIDCEFDLELTGFSLAEIDVFLDDAALADPMGRDEPEDAPAPLMTNAVSRKGDQWLLGGHRLLCGDARSAEDVAAVMQGKEAHLVFTDPPYNVAIDGHVCGLGDVRHREFAMASGEMTRAQFTAFLSECLGNLEHVMRDGAIAFVCMDWRHMGELLEAGEVAFTELKNLIVWNKTNGGMGSFYRSKHELIFCLQEGHDSTYQQLRAGRDGAVSDERLGLCRYQQHFGQAV